MACLPTQVAPLPWCDSIPLIFLLLGDASHGPAILLTKYSDLISTSLAASASVITGLVKSSSGSPICHDKRDLLDITIWSEK